MTFKVQEFIRELPDMPEIGQESIDALKDLNATMLATACQLVDCTENLEGYAHDVLYGQLVKALEGKEELEDMVREMMTIQHAMMETAIRKYFLKGFVLARGV